MIRHPQDFYTGLIFLAVGLTAVVIGQDYPMGSAGKMGPAYFPTVLGALLALIGLIAGARSFFREGKPIDTLAIRQTVLVLVAILSFGILIRGAGLIAAVMVLIFISAYASPNFSWKRVLLLAIGLTVFSILVFVKLLGLPIAMVGPWFGM
ncbi:MAG: tripartite tricarboxylate transporter TctB family protein [Burkholderiaceae bacterium]|jgi:hypothetical protein